MALAPAGCIHEVKKQPPVSLLPPGKVAVIGEVGRGGLLDFTAGMTLGEALKAAGGLTPMADANAAVLTRSVSGFTVSTSVHVGSIALGVEPDLPLDDGDVIQVPARAIHTTPSIEGMPALPPAPPPDRTPDLDDPLAPGALPPGPLAPDGTPVTP